MRLLSTSFALKLWITVSINVFVSLSLLYSAAGAQEKPIFKNEHTDSSLIAMKNLSITVLYDNNPFQQGLSTGWGFSCLIGGTEKILLFDTGREGEVLLANMKELGIKPGEVDIVVLSHAHGDHTGGLQRFISENQRTAVFLPESFPKEFKGGLRRSEIAVIEVHASEKICENAYSTGELGAWIKEQALIVRTDHGMVVITGCAHPGIVEIIRTARDLFPNDQILLVMGGFHLGGASRKQLTQIVAAFKAFGVQYVGPCHCSGDLTRQLFHEAYQDHFIAVGVGTKISGNDLQ